ncbi:hypothetical protein [Paraherbaspirillum soli]|uniref:Flagellar assembly protein FliH/Type III secretion system HrpE domain-containing protein n=1 Tax=Paraherbaspirillum soli TaxID=631222 RepID=A0ABW0MB94_9BURK
MSVVLKASQLDSQSIQRHVAPGLATAQPGAALQPVSAQALEEKLHAEQQAQLATLKQRIAVLEKEALLAAEAASKREAESGRQAYEKGVADGLKRAEQDWDVQVQTLKEGMQQALAVFSADLNRLEGLSLAVTRAVLDKMVGDPDHRREWVTASIKHQLERLAASAVLGVSVSRHDFPDAEAVAVLCHALGATDCQVDPQLPAGGCRLKLTLGTVDIDAGTQLQTLGKLFAQLDA